MGIFRSCCVCCGARANGICSVCADELRPAILPELHALRSATAVCSYSGAGAKVVRAIKFHNDRQALGPFVDALAASVADQVDVIVSVPPHPRRRRARGFDVPELMAKRMSRVLHIPIAHPLRRVDDGAQTGRARSARHGIEFRATGRICGRVLLVDDVITTGATAVSCATTLEVAGAQTVTLAVIAATPAPSSGGIAAERRSHLLV